MLNVMLCHLLTIYYDHRHDLDFWWPSTGTVFARKSDGHWYFQIEEVLAQVETLTHISKLDCYLSHLLYNLFVLIELIWFENFVPSIY